MRPIPSDAMLMKSLIAWESRCRSPYIERLTIRYRLVAACTGASTARIDSDAPSVNGAATSAASVAT